MNGRNALLFLPLISGISVKSLSSVVRFFMDVACRLVLFEHLHRVDRNRRAAIHEWGARRAAYRWIHSQHTEYPATHAISPLRIENRRRIHLGSARRRIDKAATASGVPISDHAARWPG